MGAPSRDEKIQTLRRVCPHLRIDILEMITEAGSGHPGGSLSAIDLIETLYRYHLRQGPERVNDPDRDRFILSKGHGVPALYATLAQHGYFDRSLLPTLRKLGSPLQGHPVRGTVPGIEACTGSLGQGLSIAIGMALAARLDGRDYRVWCMLGDGEMQEGQVWEAVMSAGKYRVDNLVAILDHNKAQIDGLVQDVMPIEPIEEKLRAFGWLTRRIDGHDYGAILDAYEWAEVREGAPKMIVADTIKGKGVSFMESDLVKWHGVAPSREQCMKAVAELRTSIGYEESRGA
ncbi:MAG TPA: transketolase [Sandaracinaceae bacterium]